MSVKGRRTYKNSPTKEKLREWGSLSREGDKMKFVDVRFKRWQILGFREVVGGNEFHRWDVLGMKDDLWDRVRGLGSITWKGCK